MPPIPQSSLTPTSNEQSTASLPPGSLTVFASLVILPVFFFVFGAITCHSFLHRRRHGLAMRNSKDDVDLPKKPEMWEIHLGGDATRGCRFIKKAVGGSGELRYLHWDDTQPFSAAYVDPTRVSDPQGINDDLTSSNVNFPYPAITPTPPRPLLSRLTQILNRTPLSILSPLPTPGSTNASPPNNDNNSNTTTTMPPGPSIVRIAVLIAMPSRRRQSQPSSPSPLSTSHTLESWLPDEKEGLPHVNVGVADLPMPIKDPGLEENKRKDNMGSSIQILHSTGSRIKRPFLYNDCRLLTSHS